MVMEEAMEVYVLFGCIAYEGDYMLGVYHSLVDAQSAMVDFEGAPYGRYIISRRVIGARASEDFDEKSVVYDTDKLGQEAE
jgi:hypothetical protein